MHKCVYHCDRSGCAVLARQNGSIMGSTVRLIPHIFRFVLTALIALQLSFTAGPSTGWASEYMCNPSGQAPAAAEIAQLKALFAAAGKTMPADMAASDHCSKCVTSTAATLTAQSVEPLKFYVTKPVKQRPLSTGFQYHAQGPPLGGRAPPTFL